MSTKITLPYDSDWQALNWALKHCRSYITNDAYVSADHSDQYYVNYYFGDERDATAFALRWL